MSIVRVLGSACVRCKHKHTTYTHTLHTHTLYIYICSVCVFLFLVILSWVTLTLVLISPFFLLFQCFPPHACHSSDRVQRLFRTHSSHYSIFSSVCLERCIDRSEGKSPRTGSDSTTACASRGYIMGWPRYVVPHLTMLVLCLYLVCGSCPALAVCMSLKFTHVISICLFD